MQQVRPEQAELLPLGLGPLRPVSLQQQASQAQVAPEPLPPALPVSRSLHPPLPTTPTPGRSSRAGRPSGYID